MCTHLHKRHNGVYYFRRRVPLDLVEFFGKVEFNESLKTKDRREAEAACRKRSVLTDALFIKARGMVLEEAVTPGPAPAKPMTPEEALRQERAQAEWEEWNTEQSAIESAFVDEIREDKANQRAGYRSLLAFAQASGLDMPTADKAALQAIFARSAGEVSELGDKAAGKASGPSLGDIVDAWAKDRKPSARAAHRTRCIMDELTQASGVSVAAKLERQHVIKYRDNMLEAEQSPANVNTKLTLLRTALNYAIKNAMLPANPATGVNATDKVRARDKRREFDDAALQAIFSSPVYSEHQRPIGGGGEAAYWPPVLALYTGARLEELAQLRPEDVYEEQYQDIDGKDRTAWVMRFVNDAAQGQQVKTEGSERRIPLHPELIRLGFLDYVDSVRGKKTAKGLPRIFHQLKPTINGLEAGNYTKWFGRYLRDVCKVTDTRMVFHSFRHTFKHLGHQCMMPDSVLNAIQGHTSGNVADNYGGLSYPLAPMVEAMKRYKVPGLELPPKP